MVSYDKYRSFLYHNYQPINRKKCFETMFLVWFFSMLLFFFNENMLIDYSLFFCNVIMSAFCLYSIIKNNKSIISSLLFDGVTSLYISILFNLASCILLINSMQIKPEVIIVLFSLLIIGGFLFSIAVFYNIKHDNYSKKKNYTVTGTAIFVITGVSGIILSRIFLKNISQNIMLIVIAIVFLLISIIFTTGIVYFIKIYVYQKMRKIEKRQLDDDSLINE